MGHPQAFAQWKPRTDFCTAIFLLPWKSFSALPFNSPAHERWRVPGVAPQRGISSGPPYPSLLPPLPPHTHPGPVSLPWPAWSSCPSCTELTVQSPHPHLLSTGLGSLGMDPGKSLVWHTIIVPALQRLKQEDHCKFEASLGYRVHSR